MALGRALMSGVRDFHEKCGCPTGDLSNPTTRKDWKFRLDLIQEEFDELKASYGDTVSAADALADLVYVIFGAADTWGIDLPEVISEVHRSNMTKENVHNEAGKVVKGPNYSPPDIRKALRQQGAREFC